MGKIIHIANFRTNKSNGAFLVIENICKTLFELGFDVELWGLSKLKDNNNLPFYRHFKADISNFTIPKELKREILLKKTHIDYIQLHSVFIPINTALSRFLKKNDIYTVLMPHGGYNNYSFKRSFLKKIIFFYLFEQPHIKRISCFYLHGYAEYNFLKKIKKIDKFFSPNGIDLPEKIKKRTSTKTDEITFLNICRKDLFHKGLDLFLYAVAKSKFKKFIRVKIVGPEFSKKSTKKLKRIIKINNLENHVELIPEIKNNFQKIAFYYESDVFFHTSRWEGMPMSVLEAMSYGMPVLVTENTNMGKYIRAHNAGFVCNSDINEISELIDKIIINRNNLEQISINCKNAVLNDFNWESIVKKSTIYFINNKKNA